MSIYALRSPFIACLSLHELGHGLERRLIGIDRSRLLHLLCLRLLLKACNRLFFRVILRGQKISTVELLLYVAEFSVFDSTHTAVGVSEEKT